MGNPNKTGNGVSSMITTTTTAASDDSTAAAATSSSTTVDAAVELDGCCFVLSVADVHNTGVGDRSSPFCIAGSSAEVAAGGDASFAGDIDGGGGSGGGSAVGSTADSGASLEVIKFPSDRWEIGSVQEVRVLPACASALLRGAGGGRMLLSLLHQACVLGLRVLVV